MMVPTQAPRYSPIHHRVWDLLKKEKSLFGRPWVVAISGGLDSVVLSKILFDLRFVHHQELRFVCVDHQTRDFSKERDVVRSFPFPVKIIPVFPENYSEETLRRKRYEVLHEEASNEGLVFTAHHEQDLIETVFMKLLRGGGLASFASLPFVDHELRRVRVLRSISKEELIWFSNSHGLPFVEDPSNEQKTYTRNQVRQILRELGPLGRNLGRRFVELSAQAEDLKRGASHHFAVEKQKKLEGKERNAKYYRQLLKI